MQQKPHRNIHYTQQATIIQLVGDMKQNISQLISSINCQCGINNHLHTIFSIYCNKIAKLRTQRDVYKNRCQQLNRCIKSSIKSNVYVEVEESGNQFEKSTNCGRNYEEKSKDSRQNIFQILNKELQMPISMTFRANNNQYCNTDSYLIPAGAVVINNPEDSLLLTQSSCNRLEVPQAKKTLPKINIKSFEQFLQEKAEQNHTKLKICEDVNLLVSKKARRKSPERRPLRDKFVQLYNN